MAQCEIIFGSVKSVVILSFYVQKADKNHTEKTTNTFVMAIVFQKKNHRFNFRTQWTENSFRSLCEVILDDIRCECDFKNIEFLVLVAKFLKKETNSVWLIWSIFSCVSLVRSTLGSECLVHICIFWIKTFDDSKNWAKSKSYGEIEERSDFFFYTICVDKICE